MNEVKIDQINKISIAGLIIKNIIDNNLSNPKVSAMVADMDSVFNIQAGRMKVHLIIKRGDIEVRPGDHPSPTASVAGSLDAILDIGMAKYHRVPAKFLTRNFKIGGNPLKLLPLMTILKM